MDTLISRAKRFATQAHRRIDHRRKYSSQPYEVHLKSVAQLVAAVTDDPETIAAAWLHDTVEDTEVTLDEIRQRFGPGVADLVADLTDVSRPGDGNRAARKAIDRAHTARASSRAKTVKLADLLDNCRDIRRADPRFARVFAAEAQALLEVLREGDARLHRKLEQELDECLEASGRVLPFDFAGKPPSR
jgi:(p)ppGpp synthase/HD superfamily hydrolase